MKKKKNRWLVASQWLERNTYLKRYTPLYDIRNVAVSIRQSNRPDQTPNDTSVPVYCRKTRWPNFLRGLKSSGTKGISSTKHLCCETHRHEIIVVASSSQSCTITSACVTILPMLTTTHPARLTVRVSTTELRIPPERRSWRRARRECNESPVRPIKRNVTEISTRLRHRI